MMITNTFGDALVLQVSKQVSFTLNEDIKHPALLKVNKTVQSGTIEVKLARQDQVVVLDLAKIDVNMLNPLVTNVVSVNGLSVNDIWLFQ